MEIELERKKFSIKVNKSINMLLIKSRTIAFFNLYEYMACIITIIQLYWSNNMCHKEFSIILKLTDEFTLLGYNKWFANIDKISEEKSNLRILGINQTEIIIVYDNILLTADCRKILNLLSKSHINFIYITDLIELK